MSAGRFQIRAASALDIDQLCELAGELLVDIRSEGTIKDVRRVFEHILNSAERNLVVVAENDASLCGYGYASYEWRAEFCGETMNIVALFVASNWRSKGVGRGLVAFLLANARQRGISRIRAEVHPGNSAIEHTLESSGFDLERRTVWGLRL
jgi:GNAT superfamily N-acetyltransferase